MMPHGANTGGQYFYLDTQRHSGVYRRDSTQEDYANTETNKVSASHSQTKLQSSKEDRHWAWHKTYYLPRLFSFDSPYLYLEELAPRVLSFMLKGKQNVFHFKDKVSHFSNW